MQAAGLTPLVGHLLTGERDALAMVFTALPPGVRPVLLADRDVSNAWLLAWLQPHGSDYVIRLRRGVSRPERKAPRWFLGRFQRVPGAGPPPTGLRQVDMGQRARVGAKAAARSPHP